MPGLFLEAGRETLDLTRVEAGEFGRLRLQSSESQVVPEVHGPARHGQQSQATGGIGDSSQQRRVVRLLPPGPRQKVKGLLLISAVAL